MPFIGRLDEQVDEVLIKPLSKKGAREGAPADAPAPQPATPQADAERRDEDAPARELPRPDLPVWLL